MARQLLESILDNGVANPHYFEGRLLTAAALREDQEAQRERQRLLGRALGAGVVEGLWVSVEAAGTASTPPLLAVEAGLAIDGKGQTLKLPAREIVALAKTTTPPSTGAGLFHTCPPPTTTVEAPADGFYVLAIAPASGFRGRAPFSGLAEPTAGAGCGSQSAVEGVRFRFVPLDPLAVTGLSSGTRDLLEKQLLGTAAEAGLARLRNVVAHLCLGTEPLGTFAVDPVAREAVAGGGTEAALADYGAIDDLVAKGDLTACDIPLALVLWRGNGVIFCDNWSVRRRLASPVTSEPWPTLSGGRRHAEAEAVLFQFQEQLAALLEGATSPAAIQAQAYFRWLPPAGLAPLAGGGRRGVTQATFFSGMTTRDPTIYIDGARLPDLLARSLVQPPIDVTSGEFVWTYRVRQNDLLPFESGTEFPYIVFASGHMPYVGTARFDVARFDRSNFGLL